MADLDQARSNVLRYMLRPLVRFCLRHAKPIQEFIDVLKVVYVEVALEELQKETSKINVSRLCVVTGVHRHDMNRIFREKRPPIRRAASLLARVVGVWESDKRFCNSSGQPRVLSVDGEDSEFRELVLAVSKTLNPGTVLYGLLRAGSVVHAPRGVRLVKAPVSHRKDPARVYELLARDVESLIEASEYNVRHNPEPRNLHLRTEYNNIFKSDIPKIRNWLINEGRKFHARARKFLAKSDLDLNPDRAARGEAAGYRVVLGAFSLTAEPLPIETEGSSEHFEE